MVERSNTLENVDVFCSDLNDRLKDAIYPCKCLKAIKYQLELVLTKT